MDATARGLSFLQEDAKCRYYTGINCFSVLKKLYEYLEPHLDTPVCNFSKEEMFVMTLTKLRLNTQFTSLAYDYNVCVNTISKYFHRTLYVMYECCKWAICPTDKETAIRHMPAEFRRMYEGKRVFIVDCFEVFSENPSNIKASTSHFSSYKKHNTVKYLIAIHPDGTVAFISDGFGGRSSDKEVTIQSNFLELVQEGDVVLADKGFDIAQLVAARKATLNIPHFLRKKNQFSTDELYSDKQITCLRIHVERMIGYVRSKYTILSSTIPVTALARFQNGKTVTDVIVKVACILAVLNKSIIN